MTTYYEIAPECPAPRHNTLTQANAPQPKRCICPHALRLRDEYLRRRRTGTRAPADRQEPVLRDPVPPVQGQAARRLLGPYDRPPHLCAREGHDPELWFSINPADREFARSVCARCPVMLTCQQAATDNGFIGVWGTTDEDERREIRALSRVG